MYKIIIYIIVFNFSSFVFSNSNIYYPKENEKFEFNYSFGLGITKIPMEVVEEEFNHFPTFIMDTRLNLKGNFSLKSKFEMNYVTDALDIEIAYSNSIFGTNYSISAKGNTWIGNLDYDVFDVNATGLVVSPIFRIGKEFNRNYYTLEFELQQNWMWTRSDNIELGRILNQFNGYSLAFITEQEITKSLRLMYQFRLGVLKYSYHSWIAYSFIDEYLLYPEINFGIIF